MKKIIFTCFIFVSFMMNAADISSASQQQVNKILGQFVAIEKNKTSFLIRSKIIDSDNKLELWSKDGMLKQVIIHSKNMLGHSEDHYYFNEQQLILCRSIIEALPLEASGQLGEKATVEKHYLLYQNAELINPSAQGAVNP